MFFAGAIGLAAVGAGCGESPMAPTVTSSPVMAAPTAAAGLTLRQVVPSAGPTIGGDYVRVFADGFQPGATVTIGGTTVPVIRTTGTYIEVRTLAHAEGPADVELMNPDGDSSTLGAAYTFSSAFSIEASPGAVAPGGSLTVTWHAPSGRGCNGGGDWIAIYRVGSPDDTGAANGHSDLWYDHVCGAPSGSWTIKAPDEAADYEFRFMIGGTSIARSNPVAVG
jgi:hypothetical protein